MCRICTSDSSSYLHLPQGNLSAAASYTFSAKEKDSETNLSYFGARYYTSDLSVWLSVDPMSDKYPSLSPYVYCANNPIKLVDPNGEEVWIIGDPPKKQQSFKDKVADFDRKATQVGGAFVMGLAASIPITSTINDMMIVTKGKDMFGKTATDSDKKWSKFSLATCGIGHGMKIIKNVAGKVVISTRKIIENIDNVCSVNSAIINARSGFTTTNNNLNKSKDNDEKSKKTQ